MSARLIIINGAPGVGKTESTIELARLLKGKCLVIDLDRIAHIEPFIPSDEFYRLASCNLSSILGNAQGLDFDWILVCGVLTANQFRRSVLKVISEYKFNQIYKFALVASSEILSARILGDPKNQDTAARLADADLDSVVRADHAFEMIDTTKLLLAQVVQRVLEKIIDKGEKQDAAVV